MKLREKRLERLVDADPRFYGWSPDRDLNPQYADKPDRVGLGIMFDCPIHEPYCFVAVPFKVAIDGGGPIDNRPTWDRTGDTFETLTLSPSIRVLGGPGGCRWHGFIRNGRFETCGDSG